MRELFPAPVLPTMPTYKEIQEEGLRTTKQQATQLGENSGLGDEARSAQLQHR